MAGPTSESAVIPPHPPVPSPPPHHPTHIHNDNASETPQQPPTDPSSVSPSFHPKPNQSHLPTPKPTQSPVVPDNNAIVQSAVTLPPPHPHNSDNHHHHTHGTTVPHKPDPQTIPSVSTAHTSPSPASQPNGQSHSPLASAEKEQILHEHSSHPTPKRPVDEQANSIQISDPAQPQLSTISRDSTGATADGTKHGGATDPGTRHATISASTHSPPPQEESRNSPPEAKALAEESKTDATAKNPTENSEENNGDPSADARTDQSQIEATDTQSSEKRPLTVPKAVVVPGEEQDDSPNDGPELKKRKTERDGQQGVGVTKPDANGVEAPSPERKKVASDPSRTNGIPSKSSLRAPSASVGGLLRMLRSSPVGFDLNTTPSSKNLPAGSSSPGPGTDIASSGGLSGSNSRESEGRDVESRMEVEPKKRKSVSWAPEERLVDVQYIDTRPDLIRSWDPEFEITLPFSPATLQMFKSMSEEQRKVEGNGNASGAGGGAKGGMLLPASVKMSFEEARKREHDMEQERARKAREELNKKLDKMVPARSWSRPSTIVLPAECRVDADGLERFSLCEEGETPSARNPDDQSPPSPLVGKSAFSTPADSDANVRLFPLSDGSLDATDANANGFDHMIRHDSGIEKGVDEGYYRVQSNDRKYDDSRSAAQVRMGHERNTMQPHGVSHHQTRSGDGSAPYSSGMNEFQTRSGHPLPPHTVQHLLSALQSTGLLNQPNNNSPGRSESAQFSDGMKANEREARGDSYRDPHGSPNRKLDQHVPESSSGEGAYMNDERRHLHDADERNMGPDSAIGMPDGAMGPPPPPPLLGHPGQLPPGFQQGVQPGMMEGFPFPMPPMPPPPPMGMPPNMMPLGMGIPMPPMGMPLPFMPPGPLPVSPPNQGTSGGKGGKSGLGRVREVETITRPKVKGTKQRKKCKYFGTRQGCRDGSACVFAHI